MSKIKDEIIKNIEEKNDNFSKENWCKIHYELGILEETTGINDVNNLDSFYDIYINNKNKVGDKNEINSWVAYFLGMTTQKPDGKFLPERRAFARAGFPDIDTDFDDEYRDDIYTYMIEKYGRENVGNIGAHGFLKFKSCFRRVGKALDIANSFELGKEAYVTNNENKVKEIIETFPKAAILKAKDKDGKTQIIENIDDACLYNEDFNNYMNKYPEVKKHVKEIQGTFATFACLSADTPILTKKGWIRIDQLISQKKIAFIDKYKEIKYTNKFKKFKTGNKKVYRMRLSNNSFIDVTDEHLIFTNKGCMAFKKIRKNSKKYKIYGIKKGVY